VIVAAGGDGTASAIASALAGSETILGVLPLGTLNHFARDVGIPLALAEAIRTLGEDHTVRIDVGDVNGLVFLNNVSLGVYPAFVEERGDVRRRPRLLRWFTILVAAVRVIVRLPLLRARVRVDENPVTRVTPLVFVGNNEYELDGPLIGARHILDAGHLSLIMAVHRGPWGIFKLMLRALIGKLRGAKDLDVLTGKCIEVSTKGWQIAPAIDGEISPQLKMPLRCTVRPGALRVLVPRNTQPAEPS
jgi:diacylglycerol kinase family enzyme